MSARLRPGEATASRRAPSPGDLVGSEREAVLRRTLRALPDEMLEALARGLERHADRLVGGRLYAGAAGGGCAVGVMLRELEPDAYSRRLRFWLRHGWRRRVSWYRRRLPQQRRLRHLEWLFDRAVEEARGRLPRSDRGQAAALVGRWIRFEALAELRWRGVRRGFEAPEQAAPQPAPAQAEEGISPRAQVAA